MLALLSLIGLGFGILLNSLADNLPPDALGLRHNPRRPHCGYCGAAHAPLYWLALFSFFLRGGRCERCGAPRPARPIVVELLAGVGLVYAWMWAGGDALRFFSAALLLNLFILIAVIDIEHRLILWRVIFPSALLVGLTGILTPGHGLAKTVWGGLGGYGLVFGVYLLSQLFALGVARLRGQPLEEIAFGGGDVNLAGVVGLAVGWPGVVLALVLGLLAAGLFSAGYLVVLLLRRNYKPYTAAFPLGPFLIFGALWIYFYGQSLATWYISQ